MTIVFSCKLSVTVCLGVSVRKMRQQPDITCFFSSLWWSVFKLNSLNLVICLLLCSCLAASCVSVYVQCKGFTVLRFILCLCCSWPVFSATKVCPQGLDRLYGFVPLHPRYLMTDRPPCYSKRALISSLNLLQEILRGVSILKLLLISLWHSFKNMAAVCEWTFKRRGSNVVSVPKKRTVMLECDPCTHAIRFSRYFLSTLASREETRHFPV